MRNSPSSMSAKAIRRAIRRKQSSTGYLAPMLTHLTISLQCAETLERNGKASDNGDAWYRGWKRALDLREQIALLKNMTGVA